MEYDLLLCLHAAGVRGEYAPGIIGNMTHGGVSNRQFVRTMEEVRKLAIAQGRAAPLANFEAVIRTTKIRASHLLRRRAELAYRIARRAINPSYRPVRWMK
jgi:hypothetical protein